MKIENIRLFLEIVQSGSINKAAEKLYISQPNLSVIIKNMETELGVKLLVRNNTGIRLTTAGEAFFGSAQTIIQAYDGFLDQQSLQQTGQVLHLFATPGCRDMLLGMQEMMFAEKYYLSIHERGTREIIDMIAADKKGIYLLPRIGGKPEISNPNAKRVVIAEEDQYIVFCHRDFSAAADKSKQFEETMVFPDCETDMLPEKMNAINALDIQTQKAMMKKSGFSSAILARAFAQYFDKDEWSILKTYQGRKYELALFFCNQQNLDEAIVGEELKRELLKRF